ncbi:MAG: hypothetical protein MJ227_03490 [Bacilli bacterium]|nr:hypothetical protein [Bacilli bacterium]
MKEYKICLLSDEFYEKYPTDIFSEILQKGETRPYLVLLLKIDGKQYAIPFRSNINHKYCFKIVNNRGLKEGLDYTKTLVVEEKDVGRSAHLRSGTIPQVDEHIDVIIRDFKKFIELYKKIKSGEKRGKTEEYIYSMTTLKYFD